MGELKTIDVKGVENLREYDFSGRVYRVEAPVKVQFRKGGTTHRVTDASGVTHCVPAPGVNGCVVRWDGPVVA